jgi:hypothetical protein
MNFAIIRGQFAPNGVFAIRYTLFSQQIKRAKNGGTKSFFGLPAIVLVGNG